MTLHDLRESAQRRDTLTKLRLERLVPRLMRDAGIDCWILVSREYAEDPVAQSMLPATWMSSRRRTILLFLSEEAGRERSAITRYEVDGLFPAGWDPESDAGQWEALRDKVSLADPEAIAVSTSESFAHADGLTQTEFGQLVDALGPDLSDRVVSGEALAIGWLQTRIPEEKAVYEEACGQAHQILRRALSPEAVKPGETTTKDLEWWLRERVQALGCTVWFHPSVSIQRRGADLRGSFASATRDVAIDHGDLVHIDFGIIWDHLCTDQQQHGYVLLPGETAVPEGLGRAMQKANQLQDILTSNFRAGLNGNEVLAAAREEALGAGLRPTIYTHPIGYHGHGAGATIGLWDQQDGVPGSGDVALFEPSAWSIELMNRTTAPEWDNQEIGVMLEEDAWFENGTVEFLDGRQTTIWQI
ncbi:MAG TPA: M24 family metallopeptidase [Acidimicrobiia bacterium]